MPHLRFTSPIGYGLNEEPSGCGLNEEPGG